jgi:tRNA dimethylallyltransferase
MVTRALPPLALIAGPTASGKSSLAIALAEATDGVIINADSAQLYADLPILSAAPSARERAAAEHRLYNVRDGALPCSAAQWADLARAEIDAVHGEGRLPILVGGTGLYLRTLLDGIAPIPPIDPDVRAAVRGACVSENYAALTPLDPCAAARLNPGDTSRVARALEVVRSTGRTLDSWQEECSGGIGDRVALRPLILLPPRGWLIERCDQRFEAMIEAGAVNEVQALLERKLDANLPVMKTIGVRELGCLIEGEWSREQAVAAGQIATRRYAKRQYTWFANQPPEWWPRLGEPLGDPAAALALLGAAR